MISNNQFNRSKTLSSTSDPTSVMKVGFAALDPSAISINLESASLPFLLASPTTLEQGQAAEADDAALNFQARVIEPVKKPHKVHVKKPGRSPSTLLHLACQQFSQDRFVVKTALDLDPSAARRRAFIDVTPQKQDHANIQNHYVALPQRPKQAPPRRERFSYPVNIALDNNASFDVLVMLVCAAPSVLTEWDGSNRQCSVSLALTKRPQDTRTLELILTLNPRAVAIPDRRQNLPLHVACQKACPLSVIRQLYGLNPDALQAENVHGETPLMIAQRNSKCPENVINFLQSCC